MQQVPAGWYPDPMRPGQARWWNGVDWSDATYAVSTEEATDSLPVAQQSEGTPPHRRRLWLAWAAIAVAIAIVIGGSVTFALQAVVHAGGEVAQQRTEEIAPGTYTSGTSSSPPVPAPVINSLTLPIVTGDVREVSAGGLLTEENSEFTNETSIANRQKISAACSPLTSVSPVTGGTRNSVNPVESFASYASDDGTTSVTGAVQGFATSKDAENFMDQVSSLLKSCRQGFRNDEGTDMLSRITTSGVGATQNSWTQTVKLQATSFSIGIVDVRVGRFVARSYCRGSGSDPDSSALCDTWASAVAQSAASAR
jgi:hypothetical protein